MEEEVTRLQFSNGAYLLCERLLKKYVIITKTIVSCEDIKTDLVKPKPKIPKGEVLEIKEVMQNYYGSFIVVVYNGKHYYLKPYYLEIRRADEL